MAFSERAREAIRKAGPIECAGCGLEVTYGAVFFRTADLKVVGYDCECGASVRDGIYVGSSAMTP
jgi:hypothetical protein